MIERCRTTELTDYFQAECVPDLLASVREVDRLAPRTVPLGIMHDGERFVVDRYALATAPSLGLIEPKPLAELNPQPLFTGLSEPVQGFPVPPYVQDELATIGDLIGGDVLRNQGFMIDRMRQSLGATPHRVAHIASHAQFTRRRQGELILTYDGKLDMDSLERCIKQSRFRTSPASARPRLCSQRRSKPKRTCSTGAPPTGRRRS